MTHTDIMNIIKDSYTGIVYNQSKPAEEFLSTLLQDLHFEDFSCAKSPFFSLIERILMLFGTIYGNNKNGTDVRQSKLSFDSYVRLNSII